MISVKISNQQELVELDFTAIKGAARAVFEGEGFAKVKVTLAFFDDPTIATMNMRYLQHEGPTDVLTFPYSGPKATSLEGDIAIGAGVAKAFAEEQGHAVTAELCLYAIHGCLHLCGYFDKTVRDKRKMRTKEREYLLKCGLPDISERDDEDDMNSDLDEIIA
ncbi:MAG: rRNA maturation RNase YbeY [Gemmataceae bacterium]